jgi:hypothetical protein
MHKGVLRDFKCVNYFREHFRQIYVIYIKVIVLENGLETWNKHEEDVKN